MSIVVICTGTELLKGTVLNSNLAFLGNELTAAGLAIRTELTVGDRAGDLYAALGDAFEAGDTVIVTGGLGPTRDDLTLDAVCRFLGLEINFDPELTEKVAAFWRIRHRGPVPKRVLRQARLPESAGILPNPNGFASGYRIECSYGGRARRIFLLPGPPREFEPMVRASLLPDLIRRREPEELEYTLGFLAAGQGEFELSIRLEKALESSPVELAYCATPCGTRVFVSGADEARVEEAAEAAREIAGSSALPAGKLDLAARVLEMIAGKHWRLVTAESCTGGMIAGRLTAVPGASDVFPGGVVTYANEMKTRLLGVPEEIFDNHGAVSRECAGAMLSGACERYNAACGIAVTGIAGPGGGTPEKPVGLVYIGARAGERETVEEFHFPGDRDTVRERACGSALLLLYRMLLAEEEGGEA